MDWTPEIYQARIDDQSAKRRHAAGSPSPLEIGAYHAACDGLPADGAALVLGMTPELRGMAAGRFASLVSVDASETAIDLYSDWLPERFRARERVILGNWSDVAKLSIGKLDAILGDGIVGNLSGVSETIRLFESLRLMLLPGGRCVMRNVLIPADLDLKRFGFGGLLEKFRRGLLDEAEFGFCSRMLGFHAEAYHPDEEILDNRIVYQRIDEMSEAGLLDERETKALARYRFMGRNFFPSGETWSRILKDAGFGKPLTHPAEKRLWSSFYQVQSFASLT